jgi:hypothetical protein
MVRVTPFLPLISGVATLLAPAATSHHRQESYAALKGHVKRGLMTCEQTYGANWIQCGDADSTFCYNPTEGQVRRRRSPFSPANGPRKCCET